MRKHLERLVATLFVGLAMLATTLPASSATVINNRAAFTGMLGSHTTDDYEAAGYETGDRSNSPGVIAIHTDAHMSAVFGQTQYRSTGFANLNIIELSGASNTYCAGCNGSFILDFTATSYGSSDGVYGVGFDYASNNFTLFITYGDGSSENFGLANAGFPATTFLGLTSDLRIKSIAFGLPDGQPLISGAQFGLDNLTIGSAGQVSAPASVLLAGLGLFGVAGLSRRRR